MTKTIVERIELFLQYSDDKLEELASKNQALYELKEKDN